MHTPAKLILAIGLLAGGVAVGPAPAQAQYREPTRVQQMNNDVQRLWNDTFDAHRDGDRARWERNREAERASWCRDHRGYDRCGPYYRR